MVAGDDMHVEVSVGEAIPPEALVSRRVDERFGGFEKDQRAVETLRNIIAPRFEVRFDDAEERT